MAAQAIAIPTSPQNTTCKNTTRPTTTFPPSIWGNHFLNNHSVPNFMNDTIPQQEHEQLKEEVREMVTDATMNPSKKLFLIDAVQRLAVDYHFETEINNELEKIYAAGADHVESDDLSTLALWFRLLRQQGIKASTEIFKKFIDDKGNFKENLAIDVLGMLNLYEAAHLGLHGEDILDEAISFTTSHLKLTATSETVKLNPLLAEQIAHALNRPIRKSIPRIESRHYMSLFSRDKCFASSYERLLKFAKIDFNIVQALHLKELNGLIEWWKGLDFATKLPYARDRLVECYFWIIGVYFEPKYSLARTFLSKAITMGSVLDDTFDNYGTLQELIVFTECVERWDISVIDQLPQYMKLIYRALLDIYSEMEEKVAKEGRSYAVEYGKEAMKRGIRAYLQEAVWCQKGYNTPTMEEYMEVATISSNYPMVIVNSFVGMGEIATKETLDWISNDPKILTATSVISRLMDDIVSHEFEQGRVHVASAVECYMKQYGVSEEETIKIFRKEISNAWKEINQEFMKPTIFPASILTRILNSARVMDVIYKDGDGYTNSYIVKDYIALLLVDPVPL